MKGYVNRNILPVLFMAFSAALCKVDAQSIKAPIDAQVDLIPKILALDKNFNPSYQKKICNIGIIYNSEIKNSSFAKERILWYWSRKEVNIKNSLTKLVPVDISQTTNFRETFDRNRIKAVYIAPLDDYDVSKLTRICKDKRIRTFTGVDSLFTDDISVQFDLINYKVQIYIDLSSAEAEGIEFSAYLLNIAELKE